MKAAIVTQWHGTIPGREMQALEFAKETEDFFRALAEQGKCSTPTWFMNVDGTAIWFVTGEAGDLMEIELSDAGQKLSAKAGMLLHDWQMGMYLAGEAVAQQMANYQMATSELGIAASR